MTTITSNNNKTLLLDFLIERYTDTCPVNNFKNIVFFITYFILLSLEYRPSSVATSTRPYSKTPYSTLPDISTFISIF